MRAVEEDRNFSGIRISQRAPTISHLLFVDDSIFFGRATLKEATTLKQNLARYGNGFGKVVNYDKSRIFFSRNTPQARRTQILNLLGVKETLKNDTYIEMPLMVGRAIVNVFKDLVDRAWKRINSWSSKFLSKAGREVLVKQ
ncbi:uncharacterized protein [Rutidosis leptorrhynchoides]|uniref:uncharacterized protein n=1 Tax=Rutidosis leptorrhynchoides TaxID=125765 RepID=UPI003A98F259